MKKLILAILIALAGCTSQKFEYALNAPLHANIGEPLINWHESSYQVLVATSMDHELVYSGMTGSVVRIQYREYGSSSAGGSYSMARPAFNQDLTYDIAASKEISFRKLRLRILGADTNGIQYEVLHGPFEDKPEKA
jgi:hypothetical protein